MPNSNVATAAAHHLTGPTPPSPRPKLRDAPSPPARLGQVRFSRDEIYTFVGSLLLAVNPYKVRHALPQTPAPPKLRLAPPSPAPRTPRRSAPPRSALHSRRLRRQSIGGLYGDEAMRRFCDRGLMNNPPHIYAIAVCRPAAGAAQTVAFTTSTCANAGSHPCSPRCQASPCCASGCSRGPIPDGPRSAHLEATRQLAPPRGVRPRPAQRS